MAKRTKAELEREIEDLRAQLAAAMDREEGVGGEGGQVAGQAAGGEEGEKALEAAGEAGEAAGGEGAFDNLDDVKKRRVLQHYINTGGQVGKSCRLAGISHQTHYNWLAADPAYKAAYLEAQERSLDVIEQEIIRRGVKGYKEPIIYQGKVTGYVRRFSDNLLMFLAKRRDPLYRDNPQLALGLKAAGDIKISLSIPRPDEPAAIDAEAREIPDRATADPGEVDISRRGRAGISKTRQP